MVIRVWLSSILRLMEFHPLSYFYCHRAGMFAMFKKVAAKERVCGFYSTGPKIRENDLQIAELFK